MDEKIKALNDAVKNKENKTTPDKITAINTALSTLIVDNKFSIPNKEKAGENIEKTFDASTTNDDIKILIENFIKDEKDITKQKQYKENLLAALTWARNALKSTETQQQVEKSMEEDKKSEELSNLAIDIKDNMHIYSTQELQKFIEAWESSKSRKELWSTPWYIRTIQSLILELWAQDPSINKKKLEDGIYGEATRAGILTIQKILNKPPYNESKNLIEDGKPGPFTLWALLHPIDGKITWEKLLEDKKSGKLVITPELVKSNKAQKIDKKIDIEKKSKWKIELTTSDQIKENTDKTIHPSSYDNKKDTKKQIEVQKTENKEKRNEDVFQNIITTLRVKNKWTWFSFNDNNNPYINVIFSINWKRREKKINVNNYDNNNNFDYDKLSTEIKVRKTDEEKIVKYIKAIEQEIQTKIANKKYSRTELFWDRTNDKIAAYFNNTSQKDFFCIDGTYQTRLSKDNKSVILGFDMSWRDDLDTSLNIPLKEILTPNTTNINENRLKASIRKNLEGWIDRKYSK